MEIDKPKSTYGKKYITVLSVVSSLAVVLLHANACFWSFSYESYWFTANVIESACYFAVPVFFMISGANLIDYNERYSTREYFSKRIEKTFIPFIAWSLLGLAYKLCFKKIDLAVISIKWLIEAIFNTSIVSVYWFFIPQFAMYILIPFIAGVEKSKRKKLFGYAICCMVIFDAALPLLFNIAGMEYNSALKVGGYAIYIIAGYYIDNYTIEKKIRYIIYILAIAGLATQIIGTWQLSYAAGSIVGTYKGYTNLPCVAYSIGLYTLFKYLDGTAVMNKLCRAANLFSGTTLGVYLIHWYLLRLVTHIAPFLPATSMIYRLPVGVLVFIAASLLTRLMQKVPIMRRIVPR